MVAVTRHNYEHDAMKWEELLEIVGDEPVFDSSVLMSGRSRPENVRQQLSRWVKNGRLVQLRRRIYALAHPYRKVEPHPFYVANQLRQPSYVSLQSALAFYGMIPEGVPVTTSVTTGRPESLGTGLGRYHFRHLKTGWGGPEITENNWQRIVSDKMGEIDWQKAREDVAPFLARAEDVQYVERDIIIQLLQRWGPNEEQRS